MSSNLGWDEEGVTTVTIVSQGVVLCDTSTLFIVSSANLFNVHTTS